MHLKCNIPLVPIEIFQYGLFQCRLIFGIIVSTRFYKITYNKNHLERGDFIISPFHEKWLYSRSSYLRYNQVKHCGSVSIILQLDCFGVTQTTVACLHW